MNLMDNKQQLDEIRKQVSECQQCKLHASRKRSVPGEGPAKSRVMLIGEGPGFHENEQGKPFVGQAGKFLDELLGHAGLHREEVFITNVVKCRPPGNRDPEPDELGACSAYLDEQIRIIDPLVIVTLGRFSMARYFSSVRISDIHGKPTNIDGRVIIPMYHPAAALHQPNLKSVLIEDFKTIPGLIKIGLEKLATSIHEDSSKPSEPGEHAQQLSLF